MQDSHNDLVIATMTSWVSWVLRTNSRKVLADINKMTEHAEGVDPELARVFAFFDIAMAVAWNLSWCLRPTLRPHDAQLPSSQPTKEEVIRETKLLQESCLDCVTAWVSGFQSHVPILMIWNQEGIKRIVKDLLPLLFSADELAYLQSQLENARQAAAFVAILRVQGFLGPN